MSVRVLDECHSNWKERQKHGGGQPSATRPSVFGFVISLDIDTHVRKPYHPDRNEASKDLLFVGGLQHPAA
jgi:hypothetical protein